jgi:AcrR family transcriptional regulator
MATRGVKVAAAAVESPDMADRPLPTKQQILKTAMHMFAERGFEATSLRQIAAGVGIEAGSLYNHISSKQDLLFQLITTATEDLIAFTEQHLAEETGGPADQLATAVRAHIIFYCVNQRQALVGDRELRSLTPENFEASRRMRRTYESIFINVLDKGMREGVFREIDTHVVAYGILGLGLNVAVWYRPEGRLSADEIARIFEGTVLRSVLAPAELRTREAQLA